MCSNSSTDKASYSMVVIMNKKTERIITIGLAVGLVAYFCYQVAYGAKETRPDESKCLIMDNTSY